MPLFAMQTLEQARVSTMGPQLMAAAVLALFGVSVLAVSVIGIYGVMSQSMAERAQELKLRLVLGAMPRQLVIHELKRAGALVISSAAVGSLAGAISLKWISSALMPLSYDPLMTFVFSAAIVATLALGATLIPAVRSVARV
jgi:ABC-type antimicrobial peptide transport system permease subunit